MSADELIDGAWDEPRTSPFQALRYFDVERLQTLPMPGFGYAVERRGHHPLGHRVGECFREDEECDYQHVELCWHTDRESFSEHVVSVAQAQHEACPGRTVRFWRDGLLERNDVWEVRCGSGLIADMRSDPTAQRMLDLGRLADEGDAESCKWSPAWELVRLTEDRFPRVLGLWLPGPPDQPGVCHFLLRCGSLAAFTCEQLDSLSTVFPLVGVGARFARWRRY